jgi:protein-S-isoprenylcysteine O-methyltransferase Ste14
MSIGIPIGVLGLLIRGWAAGHLAKNEQLAVSGPYAHIRNPLYAGTLVVAAGIVIACRDWPVAVMFAAVFLLVYLPVIELE